MSHLTLSTDIKEWLELLDTNSTSSSFPSTVPTATEPSGDSVLSLAHADGATVCQNLMLAFFGAGSDDQTFDARIFGWQQAAGLWVPTLLAHLSCTLSTVVGVAGYAVLNTERFVDTYLLASGFNANVSVEVVSPANNTIGHVLLDVRGFSKIQVDFDMTGATSGNALYKGL